tara:strand:- start:941 stop:1429 length:489 start_codon:yes stop_codon:yes gene_type:complete
MEFVERYVFVDKPSSSVYGNHMKINLNSSGARVPYTQIEVVSVVVSDNVNHQGIVLSLDQDAPNFNSSRNMGTVLGVAGLNTIAVNEPDSPDIYNYALSGEGSKPLLYGSLDNLVLTITNTAGSSIVADSLDAITILFKCTCPKPKEITNAFSEQIPLPSRV